MFGRQPVATTIQAAPCGCTFQGLQVQHLCPTATALAPTREGLNRDAKSACRSYSAHLNAARRGL